MLCPRIGAAQDEPASASPAPAPPARTVIDTVVLRSGGLYRGHVTEVVPNDHVSIVVTGQTEAKRIPWSEIDRVILGAPYGASPGASSSPAPAEPEPAAPELPPGQRVRVHIDSQKPVILYRRDVGGTGWRLVCRSPCDQDLPASGAYRVEGNGVARSREVSLNTDERTRSVNLHVDPASVAGAALGGVMISVGVLAAYIGLLVAVADGSSSSRNETKRTGLITFGLGSVTTISGIFIFRYSSSTDLLQTSSSPSERASGSATPVLQGLTDLRLPRGKDVVVPIVNLAF